MVGWHHQLTGRGFGWTPGVGDGQGGLVCCSSWGRKQSDTTERLDSTESMVGTFLVIQTVKRVPTMWETQVQSLGQKDPLEKGMATHSNSLTWRTP